MKYYAVSINGAPLLLGPADDTMQIAKLVYNEWHKKGNSNRALVLQMDPTTMRIMQYAWLKINADGLPIWTDIMS